MEEKNLKNEKKHLEKAKRNPEQALLGYHTLHVVSPRIHPADTDQFVASRTHVSALIIVVNHGFLSLSTVAHMMKLEEIGTGCINSERNTGNPPCRSWK